MKKVFKKSLFSILALTTVLSVSNFNSVNAYSEKESATKIDITNEYKPMYITDNFFWSHTSQFTTWSFNEEGSYIKFKVPLESGGERIFKVSAYTYSAQKLKDYIKEITKNEYIVAGGGVGLVSYFVAGIISGGTSLVATTNMLLGAGGAANAVEELSRLYPEATRFARNNF